MNYSALIQNRKSVRGFTDKYVSMEAMDELKRYHKYSVRRLFPEVETELCLFGLDARAVLEGAAGYKQFLIGSPQYMVLLSGKHPHAAENAGYIMEDLILKLTEMGLDTCWLTFHDGEYVKTALELDSPLEVAAIAAFGFGEKATKRLRLNLISMSDVDISAQRQYFQPKRSVHELVYLDNWSNTIGVEEYIGFYDDLLWEAFYAASLAPSYLNRQPYGFLIQDGRILLVQKPDLYTHGVDAKLNLGVVMLHFAAVASQWAGKAAWEFENLPAVSLPEGHTVIAACSL